MTPPSTAGRSNLLLTSLTGLLVPAEGLLAAIGLMVWSAYRRGNLTGTEAATFTVLGLSAVLGILIMLLATIAFARGARGHAPARFAATLAWLRVAAVLIALPVLAIVLGGSAVIGTFQTAGAVLAIGEAFLALVVTGASLRRTQRG